MPAPETPDAALKAERDAAYAAAVARLDAIRQRREAMFSDIIPALRAKNRRFFRDLVDVLSYGPLTPKQAACVAREIAGARTDANVEQFDAIVARCTAPD